MRPRSARKSGTAGPAGEVGPVTAQALTAPPSERIRLDDQQGVHPLRPGATNRSPQPAPSPSCTTISQASRSRKWLELRTNENSVSHHPTYVSRIGRRTARMTGRAVARSGVPKGREVDPEVRRYPLRFPHTNKAGLKAIHISRIFPSDIRNIVFPGTSTRFPVGGFPRNSEPPRDSRRLQSLRGWSHEQTVKIFAGGPRTGGPDGV
jgi:hypothetical protein